MWRSTSNPKCRVTFLRTKMNVNWHLHFIPKCHLNFGLHNILRKTNILNNEYAILICYKKKLSIEFKYPSVSHVSSNDEDGSPIHCINFKPTKRNPHKSIKGLAIKDSTLRSKLSIMTEQGREDLVCWTLARWMVWLLSQLTLELTISGGARPLIFWIHVRSGPIYWGGGVIHLAKKIIRWWYFTCKKHENIICDGILHVNMFHYFKIPYITCTFKKKLSIMNILDLILSHVVFKIFASAPQAHNCSEDKLQ